MTTPQPDRSYSDPLPVIAPEGEFDIDALPPLEAQIDAAITGYGGLILDASRITFADSMFLRLILTAHDRADLRIAAPSPTVQRLFTVVGADQVLRIHSTLDAARHA
ncbi:MULTISPECIES: STAS domain-containing protein [unclassified Streptomyces]|uniref:STAS domain-containing protein n=1 Tax=unclassified Streptomyces TaxID=2593676 RepID=UPI003243DAAB